LTLTPEGQALQNALESYDREQHLYATRYAAEHGELPEGYRKCDECGELVLPAEYHHHEKPPEYDPKADRQHTSHVHLAWLGGGK
jgi:hypothetical protein